MLNFLYVEYFDCTSLFVLKLSPSDSELDLYPEDCDDFAKISIINLFDATEKTKNLKACHKKEYVRLVCKEAALKKDFPEEVWICGRNLD